MTSTIQVDLDPAAEDVRGSHSGTSIGGWASPRWRGVVDTFAKNFERGEIGASFSVIANGYRVVDIWGGCQTPGGHPWRQETLSVFYSCSKILSALVVHHLIERGSLCLDAPLLNYWPELKAAQMGGTVRMALCHSLGLPAIASRLKDGAYNDHEYMVSKLEAQAPLWTPGTRVGYHPITFGFILGELVRRVAGKTLGQYFQEHFAVPLGLDLYIGLPADQYFKVAPSLGYRPSKSDPVKRVARASQEIGSIQNLWLFNSGQWRLDAINTAEGLAAEIPAANGVGNAHSLADLMAVFLNAQQLLAVGLSQQTISRLEAVCAASQQDATLLANTRFSCGMMKSIDNRHDQTADSFIIGRRAFGHVGMGGSFGMCDREAGFAAAYVMNQQGHGILLNERGQDLLNACYDVAKFDTIGEGGWQPTE